MAGSVYAAEEFSAAHRVPAVIVDWSEPDPRLIHVGSRPCVVIAVRHHGRSVMAAPDWADIAVDAEDPLLDGVVATIEQAPIASTAVAVLLRGHAQRTIEAGLAAESAVYSVLQAGPEFAAWRAGRASREHDSREHDNRDDDGPTGGQRFDEEAVVVGRADSDHHPAIADLTITLNRPSRHNAFDPAMRDGLSEALQLALTDPTVGRVVLRGAGPSFCSGGDLTTFGSFDDPATAHVVRLTRSPARMVAQVTDRFQERFEVRLHGACMGAGIELAAFARRVVAHPDACISLPEVALGLIPGAGGTVSIPARIGRHRTMLLALCGTAVDASTALGWGLIDEIVAEFT